MRKILLSGLLLGAGLASNATHAAQPRPGFSSETVDLEVARANARAGRDLTEEQVDLLRKYGCLSGTDHPACKTTGTRPDTTERRHPRQGN